LLESFAAYGMTVDGEFYPLVMWERITEENDGGYWPTPQANKTTESGELVNSDGTLWDGKRKPHSKTTGKPITTALADMVRMWPSPQATDWKRDGRPHGFDQKDLPRMVGGQLNPTWVEWLMGYRSGWTVLNAWVTLWFRPKRGKRLKG
jgi:hypothetical protein